jgi:cell division protease FtsH
LPRGVLLEGPPGCGKTLLARALAGEADAAFFEVSATEFVELFVGVGAARVRDLFEEAAKKAPAIVFIDELDAIGRRRGAGSAASLSHQEREQTLNQLLVSLDGFRAKARVVVVAATNRADVLDPALLRPGRFDIRVQFAQLTADERREVLAIHLKNKGPTAALDLQSLAERTAGYTGAELELAVNRAAIAATRRARRDNQPTASIGMEDFVEALRDPPGRDRRFDKLDVLLIESGSQLAQPTGRVLVRADLTDSASVEGEVIWVDAMFLKLRQSNGQEALVSKSQIRRLQSLAGTEAARHGDLVDGGAARVPDAG